MDNSLERWRPVVFKDRAYPAYEVSNLGRVRRRDTGAVVGSVTQRYPAVTLHQDRKSYTVYIHLLVAAAFLGPKPEGTHVCWRDGNRRNIAADNLYYGTGRSLSARSVQRDLGQDAPGGAAGLSEMAARPDRFRTAGSGAFSPWPAAPAACSPQPAAVPAALACPPPRLRLITFQDDGSFARTPLLRDGDEGSAARENHIRCTLQSVGGGKGLIMTREMLEHLGSADTVEVSFQKGRLLVTAPTASVPRGGKLRFAHAKS